MCADMAIELSKHNVACLSFWQCAVKTELFTKCDLISTDIVYIIKNFYLIILNYIYK